MKETLDTCVDIAKRIGKEAVLHGPYYRNFIKKMVDAALTTSDIGTRRQMYVVAEIAMEDAMTKRDIKDLFGHDATYGNTANWSDQYVD